LLPIKALGYKNMKYLQSIGFKALLLLVLLAMSCSVCAQPTSAEKPQEPGQSANALDATPAVAPNAAQRDFEPNNRIEDATPLSTRGAQVHKLSWDLDRDWLYVDVPFGTLGVVRLLAQAQGQAAVLQAKVWRQRADGSAEVYGTQRFDSKAVELAVEPFNGRMGTDGKTRRYWIQIEKAQGAPTRVGFSANYRLVRRAATGAARSSASPSSASRSTDIYVDEPMMIS
jgi:hypothetical protein